MKDTVKNLEALRQAMRKSHVDAVIIPGTDPHQSEYTSAHWKLRDWVTGFTGSNGTAVVTLTDADCGLTLAISFRQSRSLKAPA